MAIAERTYRDVDGKWVLTLQRHVRLTTGYVVAVAVAAAVGFAVMGPLSNPLVEKFRDAFGSRATATIILGAALTMMLVGLHSLLVKYLPDEVVILNPGGDEVQRFRMRSLLWKAFGAIYAIAVALALYGSGVMEKAHG